MENLLPCDGTVAMLPGAIPDADATFASLLSAVPWRQDTATIMGRRIALPRMTAWYGTGSYVYSGIANAPTPWLPELLLLKRLAEHFAGIGFNSCLVNLYRDGRDSVAWHSDDKGNTHPTIASMSLGAVRRCRFRYKADHKRTVSLDLPHGSCLIMAGDTQRCWQHAIPRTARQIGPRINLTFRQCTLPEERAA